MPSKVEAILETETTYRFEVFGYCEYPHDRGDYSASVHVDVINNDSVSALYSFPAFFSREQGKWVVPGGPASPMILEDFRLRATIALNKRFPNGVVKLTASAAA